MCPFWTLIAKSIFLAVSIFLLSLVCVYCYPMAQLLFFWRLPFHLYLTFLFQYGLWVPRAFYDTLWEGHLSSILYMERCSFPFLAVPTKRSSKRGFYVKPFIYMWTWKAYSLISVFAVYITFGWWTCLPGWICLHTWPSHLTHFLWFDNLGTKWSIDPGIHCRLVSSRHC